MSNQPVTYYVRLKKKLWIGTVILDALMLLALGFIRPELLPCLLSGIALGIFYLWSLTYNAEHPKKGIQSVFSVIRMCVVAYLIVQLAHARLLELAIVMSGLLSYKVILTVEYVFQGMHAFRRSPSA